MGWVAAWLGLALAAAGQAPTEKVPEIKWFDGVKGLNEALALQKATGAHIFLYFARYSPSDQEGLCHWFERRGLNQPAVAKFLRPYIKVKILYPLGKDDEVAIAKYHVNKCPAVFMVPPDGWPKRCSVFDWSGPQPKLLSVDELVALFQAQGGGGSSAPPAPSP